MHNKDKGLPGERNYFAGGKQALKYLLWKSVVPMALGCNLCRYR
jgi:hypothetical protein